MQAASHSPFLMGFEMAAFSVQVLASDVRLAGSFLGSGSSWLLRAYFLRYPVACDNNTFPSSPI